VIPPSGNDLFFLFVFYFFRVWRSCLLFSVCYSVCYGDCLIFTVLKKLCYFHCVLDARSLFSAFLQNRSYPSFVGGCWSMESEAKDLVGVLAEFSKRVSQLPTHLQAVFCEDIATAAEN
jgi:hypothetical protein